MAWFIIQCERKSWIKYLVEAESEDSAAEAFDSWQYLGYVDGDETETDVIGGPFACKADAHANVASHVDG